MRELVPTPQASLLTPAPQANRAYSEAASVNEMGLLTVQLNEFNCPLDNLARPVVIVFYIKAVMAGWMIGEIEGDVP